MNTWLTEDLNPVTSHPTAPDQRQDRNLRRMDLALAVVASAVVALPALLALAVSELQHTPQRGLNGRVFKRLSLKLPRGFSGRVLSALGASQWPALINILRGDMAFVGPSPQPLHDNAQPPLTLRPGLTSPCQIRRRMAVDFVPEREVMARYERQRSPGHDMGILLRSMLTRLLSLGQPATATSLMPKIQICDVQVDNLDMTETLCTLERLLDTERTDQVSFVNPACFNIAASDRAYRRTLARASLVLPDGIGTKIAADMLGTPIRQNVNGTDLFPRLCEMLGRRESTLYLLGGHPGVAVKVAERIEKRWPGVRIVGVRDGFFSAAQEAAVAAEICASGADVLLVARGVPMQDLFIDRYRDLLGVKIAMGVGGLFDFVSGRIDRAPQWMRETGLEWIYRLMQEPGRMWKRYLIGNLSFLARVSAQKAGLRTPANDTGNAQAVTTSQASHKANRQRVVLFASSAASREFPVPEDFASALLPLGHSTLIEQCLRQLAGAGNRQVDIVISTAPEKIRRLIGEGERWGLKATWHLAKDPNRPYDCLHHIDLGQSDQVLLGHADRWIPAQALENLSGLQSMSMQFDCHDRLVWSGWASIAPHIIKTLPSHADQSDLETLLSAECEQTMLPAGNALNLPLTPFSLLQLQSLELGQDARLTPPASWVRMPWGAMSPEAHVSPQAHIEGPVLIGPGCMVMAGAQIGPHTVLSRNVVVSQHSALTDCLVMAGSYIGSGLDIRNAIVNGDTIHHTQLQVRTIMPRSDALMLKLVSRQYGLAKAFGRVMAALTLVATAPLALPALTLRKLAGAGPAWQVRQCVMGRNPQQHQLVSRPLRCSLPSAQNTVKLLAVYGAIMDIAGGRRTWFGIRARQQSDWYALSPEWQQLLSFSSPGLFNAPAWHEDVLHNQEAEDAADVYYVVRKSWRENWRILRASIRRQKRSDRLTDVAPEELPTHLQSDGA